MKIDHKPYSFLIDDSVPNFAYTEHFTVMDAHCSLCAKGASWIAKKDKLEEFKIVPLQSELGRALMTHYGLDPDDPTSWLYIANGIAYTSLDAFIRVGKRLGGEGKILVLLRLIPPYFQDILYRLVARNRYRMFGKTDMCDMPDPSVQRRLIK